MLTLADAPVQFEDTEPARHEPLLRIEDLIIKTADKELVHKVSLEVGKGEIVGVVGESGSGKTLTCRAVLGLLPGTTEVTGGRITLGEQDVAHFSSKQWLSVRGRRVGAVFQDPASYLNPSLTIGRQIAEVLKHTGDVDRKEIHERSVELLRSVGLRDTERILKQYPFELSGGMLQRALLAVAIAGEPELLIADEATTALDVTVQAEVLDLLEKLRTEKGMAILLVSHDLALVAERTDRVAVFSDGHKVEEGPTKQIVAHPQHAYTKELLEHARTVVRRTEQSSSPSTSDVVLDINGIDVALGRGHKRRQVLGGVDLQVRSGEIVGLIGETGSGKTTLARTVLGLARPSVGSIEVNHAEVSGLKRRNRRSWRRTGAVQYVFQDPLRALDPDLTAGESIAEPLQISGATGIDARVAEVLDAVRLEPALATRKPAELSGGQRQRVCVARALITNPSLLICDEPASALDATNRNHILTLLDELRRTRDVGILLISHDLGTLEGLADRVAVLYHGRVVETGPTSEVFADPSHRYTQLLLASTPTLDGERADPKRRSQLRREVDSHHLEGTHK